MEPGTRLGHYEILAPLGAGGMGQVYRARDNTLDRDVAIKVLPEDFATDPERLARFEREAKLLASLNHPNIATIHGFDESDGVRFIAMELVEGQSLVERIEATGRIELDEALEIARQIALALEAAHEAGVIHRDLKPANVQVAPDGAVKVLDFGLAKAYEADANEPSAELSQSPTMMGATGAGVIMGTAPYMSPEQARGKPVDRRSDIWAFGCVFYEMLTGQPAFSGETATDTLAAIVHEEPDWATVPEAVPAIIRHLLRRCLVKEPRDRLHDIADARIEIISAVSEPERDFAAVTPVSVRSSGWRLAAPWLVAAAAVVAGGIGTFGGWALYEPAPVASLPPTRFSVNLPAPISNTGVGPQVVSAISSDGQRMVFALQEGGSTRLYLREMDATEAVPIAGTEGGRSPFFSPDGDSIAFHDGIQLKQVSLTGGGPLTITPTAGNLLGGFWDEDDWIYFATNIIQAPMRVPAAGGQAEEIAAEGTKRVGGLYAWPQLLPDKETLLVTVYEADQDFWNIALISLVTGTERSLGPGGGARYLASGHLVYTQPTGRGRQGTFPVVIAPFDLERLEISGPVVRLPFDVASSWGYPALSSSRNGTLVYLPQPVNAQRLAWVQRDGSSTLLDIEGGQLHAPRLSPEGSRVAVSENAFDLLTFDLEGRAVVHTGASVGGTITYPVWSNDGNRLLFTSNTSGPLNIYSSAVDGSDLELLVETETPIVPTSLSEDDTLLFYEVTATRGRDIWVLPPDGPPVPVLATPANERAPAFAPGGRFFAYVSDEEGQDEVYVRRYPDTGTRWKVSAGGGRGPMWSPLGHEIFYAIGDRMMAVPVQTEPSFQSGRPVELFESRFTLDQFGNANYDIADDGQRFLMVQETAPPLTQVPVIINWFDELKRLVPTDP